MTNQSARFFEPQGFGWFLPAFTAAVLWALVWKGMALYRAARNQQKGWFITLLVVNTLGILDIIYLLFFAPEKTSKKKS